MLRGFRDFVDAVFSKTVEGPDDTAGQILLPAHELSVGWLNLYLACVHRPAS